MDDREDDVRTDAQKAWDAWAAHGCRKLYQPGSVRRAGLAFFTLFGLGLLLLFWAVASGRWP
jgi:hypothetical protein